MSVFDEGSYFVDQRSDNQLQRFERRAERFFVGKQSMELEDIKQLCKNKNLLIDNVDKILDIFFEYVDKEQLDILSQSDNMLILYQVDPYDIQVDSKRKNFNDLVKLSIFGNKYLDRKLSIFLSTNYYQKNTTLVKAYFSDTDIYTKIDEIRDLLHNIPFQHRGFNK